MHDSLDVTEVAGTPPEKTWPSAPTSEMKHWNSFSFQLLLSVHHYSACSCSCPGISHRMLSVRMVAYIIKLIRKNKEKTSSQSTLFIRVLGRGPIWSAWVTTTFFLASIPVWLKMKIFSVSSVRSVWLNLAIGFAPWNNRMLGTATVPNLVERLLCWDASRAKKWRVGNARGSELKWGAKLAENRHQGV